MTFRLINATIYCSKTFPSQEYKQWVRHLDGVVPSEDIILQVNHSEISVKIKEAQTDPTILMMTTPPSGKQEHEVTQKLRNTTSKSESYEDFVSRLTDYEDDYLDLDYDDESSFPVEIDYTTQQ